MMTGKPLAPNVQNISAPDQLQGNAEQACGGSLKAVEVGEICPNCQSARLDYDGMLNLRCPACGFIVNTGGTFT